MTFEWYLRGALFEQNVIAGGDRGHYPGNNQFVPAQAFDEQFEDAAAGNFRLRAAELERTSTVSNGLWAGPFPAITSRLCHILQID